MTKKVSSPTDAMVDGFVASNVPPVASDGGLQLEPAPTGELEGGPIRLCGLGPCRHYHELASELDAQKPLDGSSMRLPVIVHRACYPTNGIEMELPLAVRDCNRWDPITSHDRETLKAKRDAFAKNNPEQYDAFVKSWETPDASQ